MASGHQVLAQIKYKDISENLKLNFRSLHLRATPSARRCTLSAHTSPSLPLKSPKFPPKAGERASCAEGGTGGRGRRCSPAPPSAPGAGTRVSPPEPPGTPKRGGAGNKARLRATLPVPSRHSRPSWPAPSPAIPRGGGCPAAARPRWPGAAGAGRTGAGREQPGGGRRFTLGPRGRASAAPSRGSGGRRLRSWARTGGAAAGEEGAEGDRARAAEGIGAGSVSPGQEVRSSGGGGRVHAAPPTPAPPPPYSCPRGDGGQGRPATRCPPSRPSPPRPTVNKAARTGARPEPGAAQHNPRAPFPSGQGAPPPSDQPRPDPGCAAASPLPPVEAAAAPGAAAYFNAAAIPPTLQSDPGGTQRATRATGIPRRLYPDTASPLRHLDVPARRSHPPRRPIGTRGPARPRRSLGQARSTHKATPPRSLPVGSRAPGPPSRHHPPHFGQSRGGEGRAGPRLAVPPLPLAVIGRDGGRARPRSAPCAAPLGPPGQRSGPRRLRAAPQRARPAWRGGRPRDVSDPPERAGPIAAVKKAGIIKVAGNQTAFWARSSVAGKHQGSVLAAEAMKPRRGPAAPCPCHQGAPVAPRKRSENPPFPPANKGITRVVLPTRTAGLPPQKQPGSREAGGAGHGTLPPPLHGT
ncbi:basic proline-rich protein-like [Camarhynchus parvulus]|uniref:basic proline-rich protein-like n=1 Tax=Geospiza parvula TaxID=87175 RepID=UPI001237F3AC|nr:basic proline-rich protein-like [Camarhynchus parvulus]